MSHYIRQRTIGCQYHLYKQNYKAAKEKSNKNKRINIKVQFQKASNFGSVQGLLRRKICHLIVIFIIVDNIDLYKGLLNSREFRRSIKDSEEDPTVPSAPRDKLLNLIC